jgi:thioredoxin-related protein
MGSAMAFHGWDGQIFDKNRSKRFMFRLLLSVLLIVQTFTVIAQADDIKTLDEAKALSVKLDKPVLLEFYKDDCEYCSQAAQDEINRKDIQDALSRIVSLKVNIKQDYGKKLSERYRVGYYFPAFFLLNDTGEIIKRWTGYTAAERFLNEFDKAMSDGTTVEQRVARFDKDPNFDDAIYLAQYYTDIMDYPPANKYYRQARLLGHKPAATYAYEIFQNTANEAWQDSIAFEDVLPMADSIIMLNSGNPTVLVKTAQIMARLGRKLNTTNRVGKYLQAAIDATDNARSASQIKDNTLLKAEYALYIQHDTTEAIRLKQSTMPADWQNSPEEFYGYAKWCLEHEIDLPVAENFCRTAITMASPGEFRGKVLNTLAMICDKQGNRSDAVAFLEQAIKEDQHNEFYQERLNEWTGKTSD